MKKRILTGLVMAAILLPILFVPALIDLFEIILIILMLVASFEVLNMYSVEKKLPIFVKILCVILTFGLFCSIVNNFWVCRNTLIYSVLDFLDFQLDLFLMIAIILISLMACMIAISNFDAGDLGKCLTQILYIGITFGSFMVLRAYGVRFIVYLLIITISTDIFALVFGLNFGKHKMAPKISPKKSWEGAIGGTCVALIIGFCFLFFYPNFAHIFHSEGNIVFFEKVFDHEKMTNAGLIVFMIVLTICMSICSQIGDLVASKLKRTYGIKDFSNVFPGHGGVLDRFDSALFTSVIFLLFLQFESIIKPLEQFIHGLIPMLG